MTTRSQKKTKPATNPKQLAPKLPRPVTLKSVRTKVSMGGKPAPATKRQEPPRPKTSAKAASPKLKPPATPETLRSKPVGTAKGVKAKTRSKLKPSTPRNEAQYAAKPETFKRTYDRVLSVISKMRREKVSLTQASRNVGIDPRSVTRWGSSALRKGLNGKYSAKKQDSLLRLVMIPTAEGTRDIAVRGSKQATLLAEYWNALHRYLQTGDGSRLKAFEGKTIKDTNGVEVLLLTDRASLNRLGSAGVLSFESIYARTA